MGRMTMSLALLMSQLLLLQLASANPFHRKSSPWGLESLCSDEEVRLTLRSHLQFLVNQLETDQEHCSGHVRSALRELNALVQSQDTCTADHTAALTGFVNQYLKDSDDGAKEKLPKSLVKFALSYGVLVGHSCKELMSHGFANYTKVTLTEKLGADKYKQLEHYFVDQSPLSMILKPITECGEIVLPADLFAVVPGLEAETLPFFAENHALGPVKRMCANILQPLYEPLLLPLARLQRAGFNNKDGDCPRRNRRTITFWTTATFLCEMVKVAETADKTKFRDDQLKIRGEFSRIALEKALELNGESLSQCKRPTEHANEPLKPYAFKVSFENRIVNPYPWSIQNTVLKSYDVNKDELERLRDTIQERSLRVMKMMAAKGHYKQLFKKVARNLIHRKESERDFEEAQNGLLSLLEAPEQDAQGYVVAHKLKSTGVKTTKFVGIALLFSLFVLPPLGAIVFECIDFYQTEIREMPSAELITVSE